MASMDDSQVQFGALERLGGQPGLTHSCERKIMTYNRVRVLITSLRIDKPNEEPPREVQRYLMLLLLNES